MSSPMATIATTCDAMHSICSLYSAIGLPRSRRHAASISSATACSTDDFPALTKEGLPAHDSLEVVRKTIAHKRALRNIAADGDDLPVLTAEDLPAGDSLEFVRRIIVHTRERRNASAYFPAVDAADVINLGDDAFGSPLVRMGRRGANGPWDHYVPHKDSLEIFRERATSDVDCKHSSFKQRFSIRFPATVADVGATLSRAKSWSSLDGNASERDSSVEGRPRIELLQHAVGKLA